MRSVIIITVKDSKGSFSSYDVEVPVSITAKKAAVDITEALNYYTGGAVMLSDREYRLKNERTGRTLEPEKTLYESGVWQGDVLILG
ncbi:MAG: EsaB/YukD family protein [Clostridiales bacterium]|nr:EsaB/YukD family protein [Clostridiales bacterium]